MKQLKSSSILILLGLIVVAALPFYVKNDYVLRLAIMSGIFILIASGHNLLMKVGQLSLGPVAFYGIGAYVSAILSSRYHIPVIICFIIAGLAATAAGWVIGRLTLRLRKAYFVLVTIGFAEFFRLIALNWVDMTNGPMGITAVPPPAAFFKGGYEYYFYAILILVVIVLWALYRMENSTIGRAMQAIRENEVLAQSVGIDNFRYMMLATLISSFLIGISGSFYAHFFQFVGPEILSFDLTITIVVMVIAGGRATLAGPVLGAILFTIIPEALRAATEWRMVIYGLLIVIIMLFYPDGLLPGLSELYKKLTGKVQKEPITPITLAQEENRTASEVIPASDPVIAELQPAGCKDPADGQQEEVLTIDDVCVYFGGVHAVDHVSCSVKKGEILAIIGPNGAGKTTLLNAITKLGPITSGKIHYQGELLNNLRTHEIALRQIVRTFQHTSLFPTVTTRRNVVLGHNGQESTNLLHNILRIGSWKGSEQSLMQQVNSILKFSNLE